MTRPSGSSIVTKCARVLDVITEAPRPLGFSEIVARTGFVKSSCHRILAVLLSEELIQHDEQTRTYHTGPRVRRWARASWHRADIQQVAAGVMDKLSDESGLNTALSILDDQHILYLRTSDHVPIRLAARAGDRAPLHCTASGKVFLAHMGPRRRAEAFGSLHLTKFTEHTKTEPEELEREFGPIHDLGYGLAVEEEYLHVLSCAAPIRDEGGTVVACLSFWSMTDATSVNAFVAKAPELVEAATHVSGLVGWDTDRSEVT